MSRRLESLRIRSGAHGRAPMVGRPWSGAYGRRPPSIDLPTPNRHPPFIDVQPSFASPSSSHFYHRPTFTLVPYPEVRGPRSEGPRTTRPLDYILKRAGFKPPFIDLNPVSMVKSDMLIARSWNAHTRACDERNTYHSARSELH